MSTIKETSESLRSKELAVQVWYCETKRIEDYGINEYLETMKADDVHATDDEIAEHRSLIESILERAYLLPSRQIKQALQESRTQSVRPMRWTDPTEPSSHRPTPRWPSGCDAINKAIGGGYGFTLFTGQPKMGKSLLAIAASCDTALTDQWSVVYINAEGSEENILKRFSNCIDGDRAAMEVISRNLQILNVEPGHTMEMVEREICEKAVQIDTERILIVVDSVNRCVEYALSDGHDYFGELNRWQNWMMCSRRRLDQRISFLAVAELNSMNEVKGRNMAYAADLQVALTGEQNSDIVDINIPLRRDTPRPFLGPAVRDPHKGRFVTDPLAGENPYG